jgi:serine/threonine protein kinase
MTSTVFGQIGPYTIERPIGQGGMASVFLARDTRTSHLVALKVVHTGADEEAREILESEQRGADLQQRFSALSKYVPKVYESGFATDYFYIAMEYIAGEDLSQAIHRARLPWERAVAITMQLCEFLEDADRFETVEPEVRRDEVPRTSRSVLLHNDLKPRNIRLMAGDEIKVLDFGAAKALSLSRKVTRNDFGSTAYLSPECLESGDRDLHSDAWALGVLLYEMVRGRPPFRAGDTRLLEQRIRSRKPPESIDGYCPPAVEAIIAKLLAPYPADRYQGPADIRADLARARAGEPTAALAEGWPDRLPFDDAQGSREPVERLRDEPATRRTHPPDTRQAEGRPDLGGGAIDTEPVTRRTARSAVAAGGDTGVASPSSDSAAGASAAPAARTARRRIPRAVRNAMIVVIAALGLNESCVAARAGRLADTVPLQDFAGLSDLWPKYESLAGWSWLGGWGVERLESALTSQTKVLAERVMANYRTPLPTVRENQWKAARDALRRGVALEPRDNALRAALRNCDGHLYRINGEASRSRGEHAHAQQEFTEAVVAFREAAALRPGWPDPFLGLARTFIYGLEDVDRGADALAQAEKHGHRPGERETTQLADGYRARGEALARTSLALKGMPQERDYLSRAAEAFREAITRYSTIPGFGNAAVNIRETQKRLDRVEQRLNELSSGRSWWPWD